MKNKIKNTALNALMILLILIGFLLSLGLGLVFVDSLKFIFDSTTDALLSARIFLPVSAFVTWFIGEWIIIGEFANFALRICRKKGVRYANTVSKTEIKGE